MMIAQGDTTLGLALPDELVHPTDPDPAHPASVNIAAPAEIDQRTETEETEEIVEIVVQNDPTDETCLPEVHLHSCTEGVNMAHLVRTGRNQLEGQ